MERLRQLHKPLHDMDISVSIQVRPYGVEDYSDVHVQSMAQLLRSLAGCVPVQICRGEFNRLTLMCDGQRVTDDEMSDQGGAVAIARGLRFGILSPLLAAWRGRCIVVSSMGKQSTGKSYFLNHLTGTSFATAGARCTDGAWMSVCELSGGVMLVVLDFEGIGSFERSKQEDVFLSVLNAAVSMLTVFRMEMRLDKEFDELFAKFQQGAQLIPRDAQLFRGKLSMSVKDVNPHDVQVVVDEFYAKCSRLLKSSKESNFLTDMYGDELDIHCSPPLGTSGYYDSLLHIKDTIEAGIVGGDDGDDDGDAMGFESGKAFLASVRLILAKISILARTIGHDASGHRCDASVHECGQPCKAVNCAHLCVQDVEVHNGAHRCAVDGCVAPCGMDGCHHQCSSPDHFHGVDSEAVAVHMCDASHACYAKCIQPGICHIDVVVSTSTATFAGARGSFEYASQEMNGSRNRCVVRLDAGQVSHDGPHRCDATEVAHYCEQRCPCCSYYCQRPHGHDGKHSTTHGNMRSTVFLSDERNLDVPDRKYTVGERGTAEMCSLYCAKMGRGHVHYLDCDQGSAESCVFAGSTSASADQRRHCTRELTPSPANEQDEVLHSRFWDTLGWVDPCPPASGEEADEFERCPFQCSAPDHRDENTAASYCVLPAWHEPAVRPRGATRDTFKGGHHMKCLHVNQSAKRHFLFIIESSEMMELRERVQDDIAERIAMGFVRDTVSVVAFGAAPVIVCESIVCESRPILECTNVGEWVGLDEAAAEDALSLVPALRVSKALLSRIESTAYRHVLYCYWRIECSRRERTLCESLVMEMLQNCSQVRSFGCGPRDVVLPAAKRMGWVTAKAPLDTIAHAITASEGAKSGLAVAASFAELICVVCLLELSVEATIVLLPCRHELHRRCFESIPLAQGKRLCPTCRCEAQHE